MSFLPVNKNDMNIRNWKQLDFLFISGDAYVDHPSFGHSIITRLLEAEGYKIGIIAQPDWNNIEDFKAMGIPKYAVLISSGVIDSMVNHYTVAKKVRNNDLYTPGNGYRKRPDRAVIVYSNKIREAFGSIPIILGGVEASLRRFAHYDYWSNEVKRSILLDSQADMIIYGMGEKPIIQIANNLKNGKNIDDLTDIRGTVYKKKKDYDMKKIEGEVKNLYSFEEVTLSKIKYAKSFRIEYEEQDYVTGKILIQKYNDYIVVQNPPIKPMTVSEMDRIYSLPYERNYHPMYEKYGGIRALEEVKFSITSHRGCFGGCSFCSINFHQGRIIQKRSKKSIVNEAKKISWLQDFNGYIHDVGGPTANFRNRACKKQDENSSCKNKQCMYPEICKNMKVDHSEYIDLLRSVRSLEKVKKVFIRSGIRYDYLINEKDESVFYELCENHVSGQLKVAPEHASNKVLNYMGKPGIEVFERFVKKFNEINNKIKKEQYLVPYLISSHPGSSIKDAIELAEFLKKINYSPEQVQDFYPTPGTISTCMYYTGIDPRNMQRVFVERDSKRKLIQRALLQFNKKENYDKVYNALISSGRRDLIGNKTKCLIGYKKNENKKKYKKN